MSTKVYPHVGVLILQLVIGLLALAVLGFLAFFLVGMVASARWFDRSNEPIPKAVQLGALAVKEVEISKNAPWKNVQKA